MGWGGVLGHPEMQAVTWPPLWSLCLGSTRWFLYSLSAPAEVVIAPGWKEAQSFHRYPRSMQALGIQEKVERYSPSRKDAELGLCTHLSLELCPRRAAEGCGVWKNICMAPRTLGPVVTGGCGWWVLSTSLSFKLQLHLWKPGTASLPTGLHKSHLGSKFHRMEFALGKTITNT